MALKPVIGGFVQVPAGVALHAVPNWAALMAVSQGALKVGDLYKIAGQANVTQVVCNADAGGSLNGTSNVGEQTGQTTGLTIAALNQYFTFWFNIASGAVAPTAAVPNHNLVEVDAALNASATVIAAALAAAVTAQGFAVVVSTTNVTDDTLTITDPNLGARICGDGDSVEGLVLDTGFAFSAPQTGGGIGGIYEVIDPTQYGTAAAFALAGNPVGLLAATGVGQNINADSENMMQYGGVVTDTAMSFDGVTKFTAPTPGIYMLQWVCYSSQSLGGTSQSNQLIYINGVETYGISAQYTQPDNYYRFAVQYTFQCNAGDVISLDFSQPQLSFTTGTGISGNAPNFMSLQQLW